MMNNSPNNFYLFRQRIDQSTQSGEIVVLIQEIDSLRSDEGISLNAYDLLVVAFQALQELTRENVSEGERLIVEYLLPYLFPNGNAPVGTLSAIGRLRECLVEWFDQYPELERSALRARVLDQLLQKLQAEPSPSICWIISDIGFRRQDIVRELWELSERYDNELGDTALATLTSLGVPVSEKARLLAALHQRIPRRATLPLITAVRRLADPSCLTLVQTFWLGDDTELSAPYRSLALRILPDIADASVSEEIQDHIWQVITDLFQRQQTSFAFDIYLGSDVVSRCNSIHVVPTLLRWIGSEQGSAEVTADHRRLLSLRLENCVQPRQLQGWKSLTPSPIPVLRQDACQDTRFEGRAATHEMHVKEAAWNTLFCMGYRNALNWFEEAVSGETNRYFRRQMCDLFACFQLDPLPVDVSHWITEPFDARLPASSAELVARLGAIKVARSTASRDSFEALLACGLSLEGQNLREAVDALEDVARSLARRGDHSVVSQLVGTVVEHPEGRRRAAAGGALEPLVAEGLLPEQYIPPLTETLLQKEDRDPFERSMIVAALGHLSEQEFPKELHLQLHQWARDRNDWLGIQSLFTLARQDALLDHEDLVAKVGLKRDGEQWLVLSGTKYAEWAAHVIGLLYVRHPAALLPAVASLVERLNWASVVPIIWSIYEVQRGKYQPSFPLEIAEALVRRIRQAQTQYSAELDVFQMMAELMPERLAQESWDAIWDEWLPDARVALADALGIANVSTNDRVVPLLRALTADGQYAVRRAAYRGLAGQSPQSLQALCVMWSQASRVELRQRAAEAWAWLPEDSEVRTEVYQRLAVDAEQAVRETAQRTWQERRKREWANEYVARIRDVTGDTNEGNMAVWCYTQALTHVGDDTSIRVLRNDLRMRSLAPHLRYWLQRIIKETDEHWQKAISKWPQPWRTWLGTIEEGEGWILLPDEQKIPVHYAFWQERATSLSESSTWGGTIQVSEERGLWEAEEIRVQLADERQGKVLFKHSGPKGFITIIGQGLYPGES